MECDMINNSTFEKTFNLQLTKNIQLKQKNIQIGYKTIKYFENSSTCMRELPKRFNLHKCKFAEIIQHALFYIWPNGIEECW